MEVTITSRVDFKNSSYKDIILKALNPKSKIMKDKGEVDSDLKEVLEQLRNYGEQPECTKLNQKSVELFWDLLGSDWEDALQDITDTLFRLGCTGVFSVICGDDGWYEVWTNIKGVRNTYHSWNGQELDEIFDELENFMPVINKVRKVAIKSHVDVKESVVLEPRPICLSDPIKPRSNPVEHWHPEDPVWLEQREKDWEPVLEFLKTIEDPDWSENYLANHKELFFYGTYCEQPVFIDGELNPVLDPRKYEKTPKKGLRQQFCSFCWHIYMIWYHPTPEVLNLKSLYEHNLRDSYIFYARNLFFEGRPVQFPVGYLKGKEQFIMQVLFPSYEVDDSVNLECNMSGYMTEARIGISGYEYQIADLCKQGTLAELSVDDKFVPNAMGQFLWDHVSYALEKFPEIIYGNGSVETKHLQSNKIDLLQVISEVLSFKNRTDESCDRPSTVAMAERLTEKYEKKTFSKPMLELWDRAINILGES